MIDGPSSSLECFAAVTVNSECLPIIHLLTMSSQYKTLTGSSVARAVTVSPAHIKILSQPTNSCGGDLYVMGKHPLDTGRSMLLIESLKLKHGPICKHVLIVVNVAPPYGPDTPAGFGALSPRPDHHRCTMLSQRCLCRANHSSPARPSPIRFKAHPVSGTRA